MYPKAKLRWIKEGGVNSKFFHGWINKKNKVNGTEGLLVDNTWIESVDGVKEASCLWGINIGRDCLDRMGYVLGYKAAQTPFSYLGLDVGINHRRSSSWVNMVNKIWNRLLKWNGKHISFAGRITLIQVILSVILIYYFSFFRTLVKTLEKLLKFKESFFGEGVVMLIVKHLA
ncbi:hypothetical protein ACS0TY_014524 [Phlomoides rotata]